MQHKCNFCRKIFNPADQLSSEVREHNLRKELLRLEGIAKAELLHEQQQIFESKRIPRGSDSPLPATGVCAACEDDDRKLVAINGLLFIDAITKNPTNPEKAIKALLDELTRRLPLPTYDLH